MARYANYPEVPAYWFAPDCAKFWNWFANTRKMHRILRCESAYFHHWYRLSCSERARASACVIWMAVISQHTISSSYKRPVLCVCVCCWHSATGNAWSLPITPTRHCNAVAATVSTGTHTRPPWPLSSLTLGFPLGLRYRDIAIRTATIIDMDFLLRYNHYVGA